MDSYKRASLPLTTRVIRSGIWVFALRISARAFSLVRLVILARFLVPQDFGLMGIALLTMATLETFSQTGFHSALIQKKENSESYLNTAWTVMIIRGLLLFVILYLVAPYAALFFNAQEAKPIIQVIALSLLLRAFTNIGIIYFQKELKFNRLFLYQWAGTLTNFVVAISSVLILKNVWALVLGSLAANFVQFILSYVIHPYRPHLDFDLVKAKELFGFGKWVVGSTILVFLITQGDDAFVGKILGVMMLGFYQMAYKISNMPTTEITKVISKVTFPAYSKLQDDITKLREGYLKVLEITVFLSFPIAGLIFVLAPDFTRIFLGEKWIPMVPAMQVLVFAGLIRAIFSTTGPIFFAVGKPKIDTFWQLIRLLVLAALIYPLTSKWGILGASIAVFFSVFISNIGFILKAVEITKCGIKNFSKIIFFHFVNVSIMVLITFALKAYMNTTGILNFFLLICAGIFIYLGLTYLFDKLINNRMQSLIKESLISMVGS